MADPRIWNKYRSRIRETGKTRNTQTQEETEDNGRNYRINHSVQLFNNIMVKKHSLFFPYRLQFVCRSQSEVFIPRDIYAAMHDVKKETQQEHTVAQQ